MENGEVWSRLFTVTCWWLWKWRNERCFRSVPNIPMDQLSFIFARIKQIDLAMKNLSTPQQNQQTRRVEAYIRWIHPRVGWVKLNTDGAGGIIHGHRGELFETFAVNCGVCSCTRAELLAVLRGLSVAWNGGHRKVQVEVDSEVVVSLLTGDPLLALLLFISSVNVWR